ncbi:hypothetical protein SAMN06296416_101247 [Pseudoxanthomonas wuyuanensis]|uniref:Lipoprotein n=2 Tax=Pseudoxanthomonas wuyuanensis TaxID=1073196 RepID=A0A286CW66_9GAMM|nr:hypothetical protein SAMN06296416_101247 [Pseudoxanthomonas wuyuanensis]
MRGYRAAACLGLALALAGCMGDPDERVRRLGKDVHLISSDRCAVLGDELERDIRERAIRQCPHGVAQIGEFRPQPSKQGSLLGECLRAGKLQAQVTCHGKNSQ